MSMTTGCNQPIVQQFFWRKIISELSVYLKASPQTSWGNRTIPFPLVFPSARLTNQKLYIWQGHPVRQSVSRRWGLTWDPLAVGHTRPVEGCNT